MPGTVKLIIDNTVIAQCLYSNKHNRRITIRQWEKLFDLSTGKVELLIIPSEPAIIIPLD